VAEIDGRPVTERVYVDRYWPRQRIYEQWFSSLQCQTGDTDYPVQKAMAMANALRGDAFNSHQAMLDLGRADAASLSQ
jgi:hypothetical protein